MAKLKAYSLPAVTATMRVGHAKVPKRALAQWQATNKYQERLLQHYQSLSVSKVEELLKDEMTCKAKKEGNSIKMETLLKVVVHWLAKGTAEKAGKYNGVLLTAGFTVFDNDVVRIKTKSGDMVYMKAGSVKGSDSMKYLDNILALHEKTFDSEEIHYDELVFPKAKISKGEVDMSLVLGMGCGSYVVDEAKQTVDFDIDEVGAKVEVKVQMKMTKSAVRPKPTQPKRFTISGAFTVWMFKLKSDIPYFAANVTTAYLNK